MKSRAFYVAVLSTIAIGIAASLPAQAQRARVFVSVNGNDANPCTAGSPCKTFQVAHDAVLPGGEISVLDTGGYGPLTITKAISIVAIGVEASIAAGSGVDAITINASATDKISLRGLTLDGQGVGGNGIRFNSGMSLTLAECSIRNFAQDGLLFLAGVSSLQSLTVSNSSFNDNTQNGLAVETFGSDSVTASLDRSTFSGNHIAGLLLAGGAGTGPLTVGVTDSVAANNGSQGYFVESSSAHSVSNLSLTHSMAEGNGTGVQANGPNSTIWLAQSTVTGNGIGFDDNAGTGVIKTYGDNYLQAANGSNSGTLSNATRQ